MAICLLLAACTHEDDFRRVEEGLPVSLKFFLTTPAPNEVTTRATDRQETKVEKLALFFYQSENSTPLVYEVPEIGAPQEASTTNYLYNVEVPEDAGLTSGDWYLYAVANWDKGFWDNEMTLAQLSAMTKAQMDEYCIQKKHKTLDITETALLLTGKYGDQRGGCRQDQHRTGDLGTHRTEPGGEPVAGENPPAPFGGKGHLQLP